MSGKYNILVDREVIEVDLMTWAIEFERVAKIADEGGQYPWMVGMTTFATGEHISTVFLGLDHSFRPDGRPELFETMLFPECDDCLRCATWDEALVIHRLMVADCVSRFGPPVKTTLVGVL